MPGTSPNILLMTCHDLGRFLGCYGVPTVQTPHIDRLAAKGIRFTRHFCTAPQCSSSRASMFTGRYPHSNGVMGLTHGDFGWDMHSDERLIGQVRREHGYATIMLGIHHETYRGTNAEVAARCGMDVIVPPGTATNLIDAAIESLTRFSAAGKQFYMQLGFHEPHRASIPDEAEPEYMGFSGNYIEPDDDLGVTIPPYLKDDDGSRVEMAELQGAVRYLDTEVGRLLAALQSLGLDEQTLVILTTDHGLALPRAKCSLYDPGLEAALVLRLPARGWTGGRVYHELISNIDLYPTLLDVVGIPVPSAVQGRSLVALIDTGPYEPRDCIYGEMTYHDYYDPVRCIRTERHKLIVNFSAAPSFMDPSQSWRPRSRSVVPPDPMTAYHPPLELYDLELDPNEWRNLAYDGLHDDILRNLLARLHAWMRDTGDPLLDGAVTSPTHRRALAVLTHELSGS